MLGVLGGMGPMATVDFMRRLVAATPAERDQDHLPVIVWSCPDMPDRSSAIVGEGPDPLPHLVAAARTLTGAGATFIAMPCNTAHHWHAEVSAAAGVPVLHIAECAVDEALSRRASRVGVLATAGTVRIGLYQMRLERQGVAHLLPRSQEDVSRAVAMLKAGRTSDARTLLRACAGEMLSNGCSHILLACTEIPLVFAPYEEELGDTLIDATDCLARASVRHWKLGGGGPWADSAPRCPSHAAKL